MKFRIYLKDPDGFDDSVQKAAQQWAEDKASPNSDVFDVDLVDEIVDEVWEALGSFVKYREYVILEFDTETGLIEVLPQ